MKRDDFNSSSRKLWWQYDLEGPATGAFVENGTMVLQLLQADNTQPWTNTSLWDGHNMYGNVTVTIRARAVNPVRPGSRGWGFWYTNALSEPTEQAWFMQVGDDPSFPNYNSANVWWRASAMNMYQNPTYIEEVDLADDILQWHTYKIVRDMNSSNEFTFYVDGTQVMQSQNIQISSLLSVQIWDDNLVYYRDPSLGYFYRAWSGGTPDKFVLDYVEILTDVHPGQSITPSGSTLLREIPNEVASGAANYLWKNYSFSSQGGRLAIIVTARAENYGSYGDDDDVKIVVDHSDYNWDSPKSFNGAELNAASKTIVIDTTLSTGSHTLQIWADQSPLLFDATVIGTVNGSIVVNDAVESTAAGGTNQLFKTYHFSCNAGELSIYVSATADEDPTPSNYGRSYSNFNDSEDDDIRIKLDGTDYGWQNDNAIWGNRLFGESKSVLLKSTVSAGSHTLRIFSNRTPTLHRVLVYSEQGDASLPVEISTWNGRFYKDQILLQWSTESEINNAGFNIYRAEYKNAGNILFNKINKKLIPGAGSRSYKQNYQFVDRDIEIGKSYLYKLEDISLAGIKKEHKVIPVSTEDVVFPSLILSQNYPNPFNNKTKISLYLEHREELFLAIYSLNGDRIRTIAQDEYDPGIYYFVWDGKNDNLQEVSSGAYFYQLRTSGKLLSKKLLYIK